MSKNKVLYQFIILLLLSAIIYYSSIPIPRAFANEVSLRLSPSVLQIQSQVPNEIQTPFTIENRGNEQITVKIGYKIINRAASQDGVITFLNDTDASMSTDKTIFDKIQVIDEDNVSRDAIILGPLQKKRLQLRITLPPETPSTDYYFSLIFAHDNQQEGDQNNSYINKSDQKSLTTLQTGIALNVLLSSGPTTYPQGNISEFSTPFYSQSGPIPFTVQITNVGQHFIAPKGEIVIKNVIGQTIETLSIPSTTILSGTTRSLTDTMHSNLTYGSKRQAIWPQKFVLGYYTATLRLMLSADGPFYTKTIQFVAFPLIPLLVILLSLPILFFIYLRVKKRL